MTHQCCLQLVSEGRVSTAAIAHHPRLTEVGREPGERRRAFQTPSLGWPGSSRIADVVTIKRPLLTDERWFQSEHQTGFRQSRMQTVSQFMGGHERVKPWDTTPEETGKYGH